jgi:hypothetical protein
MITLVSAAIVVVVTFAVIFACHKISDFVDKRQINNYYNSINKGDAFVDPYYANDPFSSSYRIIKVIDKQDYYIQYESLWVDSKTHEVIKAGDVYSEAIHRFKYIISGYRQVKLYGNGKYVNY